MQALPKKSLRRTNNILIQYFKISKLMQNDQCCAKYPGLSLSGPSHTLLTPLLDEGSQGDKENPCGKDSRIRSRAGKSQRDRVGTEWPEDRLS